MIDTSEHLADDNAFQSTFHRLERGEVFHFEACRGQYFADFFRWVIAVDVLFQPVIGDFHSIFYF